MSNNNNERLDQLYNLLPAIYRSRDADPGMALQAMLQILTSQAQVVEADIARLYANWFIESCEEWVVPYLGDLLGVRGLLPPKRIGWSQRALVANTLRYRRRKGTPALLEQLAHDVAGWEARTVELFTRVGTTQQLDHLRPQQGGTANLKQLHNATLLGSAFDPLSYTADLRRPANAQRAIALDGERPRSAPGRQLAGVGQARPNLPNLGLYVWRMPTYRVEQATAFVYGDGCFTFDPLGQDRQLFNHPNARDFMSVAQEHELPVALRCEPLAAELAARRQALVEQRTPESNFFGDDPPFAIFLANAQEPIPPEDLVISNLAEWTKPEDIVYQLQNGESKTLPIQAAVDPVLGRIALAQGKSPATLRVNYSYAFSADIGGGTYDRRRPGTAKVDTVSDPGALRHLIIIGNGEKKQHYSCTPTFIAANSQQPLVKALEVWSKQAPAVIQVDNDATYQLPPSIGKQPELHIDLVTSKLVIQAANKHRPVLVGDLTISGVSVEAELTLSGLLIDGAISLRGTIGQLRLVDCTVMPKLRRSGNKFGIGGLYTPPSVTLQAEGNIGRLSVERCIMKTLRGSNSLTQLNINDSIIEQSTPSEQSAVTFTAPNSARFAATLQRCTFFGAVNLPELTLAENVLFSALVTVDYPVTGELRNCYVPFGSKTPHPIQCVPAKMTEGAELLPAFTARQYGEAGYAQLSVDCPSAIRTGGTEGAEIGVFHSLRQPQREAALLAQVEEYLRLGLEVGLVYVT